MANIPFFIGPFEIITVLVIYLVFVFTALYFIGKREKGLSYFLWLLVILCFPFIGPMAYFFKYFVNPKVSENAAC